MKYLLTCPECGNSFADTGFSFSCPKGCNSVVKTEYGKTSWFSGEGLWRYMDYLPLRSPVIEYNEFPAIFPSEEYSEMYEARIFFILNGYSPDHGVKMKTCTFKELEAIVSLKYAEERGKSVALASVGNTANAFMELAKHTPDVRVYLFVPEKVIECVFEVERSDNAILIMVRGGYGDATKLARTYAALRGGIVYEGGGLNFTRRDALSTLAYSFVERTGTAPDAYIQSVGSGTGAIAFHDGLRRLGHSSKIIVVQNEPFTPIVDAWRSGSFDIPDYSFDPLDVLYSKVLSNPRPLYALRGGLYDILRETGGDAVGVSENDARKAGKLFKRIYGIEPFPASAVTLAALEKLELSGSVAVNITGSGLNLLRRDYKLRRAKPDYVVEHPSDLELIR